MTQIAISIFCLLQFALIVIVKINQLATLTRKVYLNNVIPGCHVEIVTLTID